MTKNIYSIKNSTFYLNNKPIGDHIGICYSYSRREKEGIRFLLQKHGNVENVYRWSKNIKNRYFLAGLHTMASEIHFISLSPNDISLNDLNKTVNIAGYGESIHEQLSKIITDFEESLENTNNQPEFD